MGQTLEHGIYLPDEGERNCYSGLAANWQLLDGAVGTVAEHTTALAGKAPAVHTHTKADITDFPVYGTTAGTICEGNDSRLSDARTPVAHTHTKSDVTDLLNSNFIPSANNSYDLGSSSYQWNNLYAKNYFYNGTAWGLDKDNNWLKNQSFIGERLGNEDSVNTHTCLTLYGRYDTVQSSGMIFTRMRSAGSQGSLNDNAASRLGIDVLENGVRTTNALLVNIKGYNSETGLFTRCELYSPLASSRLGTSTNKWKSFNGINPGALSFPNFNNADPIDFSQWDVTGAVGSNYYTPTVDGWLNISIRDRATNSIFVYQSGRERVGVFGNGSMASDGRIALLMPVQANATYAIIIKASANSDIYSAKFFPCLGNV